jgi:hypothetical protein
MLAAGLKLPAPPTAASIKDSESKSGTGIMNLIVPLVLRIFQTGAAKKFELRKEGTSPVVR